MDVSRSALVNPLGSLCGFVSQKSLPRSPFSSDGFAPDELLKDV
jgi:hypothetical protein